ncbi:S-layer homology domain-containing protein [Agathobaculum sp.]|uniref:S-layer homology domain-containing protein n=1 Tax=Agathobaculum sp. TaxID=2048138 RepID=UPI003A8F2B1A
MKRRLLSAFLAVMMVLTMAPVAFAADETNTTSVGSYDELVNAIASAENGATITLSSDINVTQTIAVKDKTITLNLNGKKLSNEEDLWDKPNKEANNWSLISVRGTGNLTITGNGTLDAKKDDCYAVDVQDETAKATLENGTFVGNITTVYVFEGTLVVKDGSYSIKQLNSNGVQNQYGLTINCYDQNYKNGTAKVLITGGTFAHFNPVDNAAEGTGTNFATSGYETVKGTDGLYTAQVKSDNAAAIDDVQYATLADAVAAANNGDTVTLLKNTAEDVVIPADKTVTLDLNGKKLTNVASHTIFNNGTLTIKGEGTVDNVTNGKAAVYNAVTGKASINGGSYTRSAEASKDENNSGGNSWYVIHNYGIMNINKGTFKFSDTNVGAFSSLIHNGWYDGSKNTAQKNAVMTINDGDFTQGTGGKITVKNDDYGELEIKGGVFTQPQKNYYCIFSYNIARISGGTINGYVGNAYGNETYDKGDLTISDNAVVNGGVQSATAAGNDSSDKKNLIKITDNAKVAGAITSADVKYVSVSGGYFTTDPSDYVASGYVAGTSDVSGYSYKVVAKTSTGSVEVKPAVAKPEVKVDKIPQADKEKVAAAAATVSAPTLGAETGDIVKDINEDTAKTLIEKATTVQGNNKKLYVQSSLKVEPTAYNAANKTLALDITPQYRVVASTATKADEIKLDGDTKNAQVVQDYQNMTINTPTEVTMELPTGFAVADGAKLSIKHTKSNGTVEYYTGTVTEQSGKPLLTFTTNGFSPFVISVPAASIGENVYPTLQAAVENVKKNETIKLAKDVDEAIVVTVAKSINFKVDTNSKKFDAAKNIVAGSNTTVKVTGESSPYTYEFTYTKPSSSSSGSSSGKTTYKVTTSAVNNGGVNASPSNAEKGATITITLSPDKGYKLDKLTVTDGSGKTVSTVKKSDTVYTFTMPASAVNVGVSYVKATETPSETKFNDVSANDWFASAVDYVTGKGMMNGTADNTFSPKANTTRGMVVTVLYRLENQPSTSAASFTDVASGAYYANAVAWANANGIVSGYGSGKFGPNDKVTREQLAAILYRYAQYKKYDVSVGEDTNILSYDDAQSISSYAIPAIQWACGAGVVTGKSGSKLDSKGNATRAEVAAMLMRFCENVK